MEAGRHGDRAGIARRQRLRVVVLHLSVAIGRIIRARVNPQRATVVARGREGIAVRHSDIDQAAVLDTVIRRVARRERTSRGHATLVRRGEMLMRTAVGHIDGLRRVADRPLGGAGGRRRIGIDCVELRAIHCATTRAAWRPRLVPRPNSQPRLWEAVGDINRLLRSHTHRCRRDDCRGGRTGRTYTSVVWSSQGWNDVVSGRVSQQRRNKCRIISYLVSQGHI